jgi:small neutral amino acid transporter SnatA (MarC family)
LGFEFCVPRGQPHPPKTGIPNLSTGPSKAHFWQLILGAVVALLPVINPVAATPVLLTITEGDTDLGIAIVAVISYVTLRLSGRMVRLVGANGMNALTKFMGFLLLCIGVQFVVNGITSIATDPELRRAIRTGLGM